MSLQPEHGTLAARVTIPAGEPQESPLRHLLELSRSATSTGRSARKPDAPIPDKRTPTWRNYYATTGPIPQASARDALTRWDELAGETIAFRDGVFGSTLPAEIKDAASATLALLRTATVIRLEGGEIWAWEGQHTQDGSCEGTCTHVWNYQQALSHLFPALERTLRETEFTYNQLPTGGLTFRQKLPLGSGFDVIGPCADGHFGAIIKTYRDWKLSGDTDWLRRYWPKVKRADRICLEQGQPRPLGSRTQTGILSGRQHQTLDMELFKPNSWLGSMYVAALLAASEMAEALGETDFAEKCGELGRNGADYIDEKLFNGRWFVQKIDLSDKSRARRRSTPAARPACSPTASWRPTGPTSIPS